MAVYEVKTKSRRLRFKEMDPVEFEQNFNQTPMFMGQLPEKPSDDFLDSIKWAQSQLDQMKSKKAN
jgi:hypothetical protein